MGGWRLFVDYLYVPILVSKIGNVLELFVVFCLRVSRKLAFGEFMRSRERKENAGFLDVAVWFTWFFSPIWTAYQFLAVENFILFLHLSVLLWWLKMHLALLFFLWMELNFGVLFFYAHGKDSNRRTWVLWVLLHLHLKHFFSPKLLLP